MPAIELLQKHTVVVNVDSGIDYRLRTLQQAEIFHYPLDQSAQQNLDKYFAQLARDTAINDTQIDINNRSLACLKEGDGVVMFEFVEMCDSPRSHSDYIELSRCYNTVFLADVKAMDERHDDLARRFIAMVDEFYERHVKLIISAEVPAVELYQGGRLQFEFKRCLSRLIEMQSTEYLGLQHLP